MVLSPLEKSSTCRGVPGGAGEGKRARRAGADEGAWRHGHGQVGADEGTWQAGAEATAGGPAVAAGPPARIAAGAAASMSHPVS